MNQDFKELLQVFAELDVEYLIAGGYAVIFHTQPRYTKGLDLWIKPSPENAKRLQRAFYKFGLPMVEVSVDDFAQEGIQFSVGVEPCCLDFLTTIPGLAFDEAWRNKVTETSLGFPVHYVGMKDMKTAKRTAGRLVDLADIEELERAEKANSNNQK
jgi:hypothetical protein